jgi:monoterpene epsilon-lactone hydrolase
MASLQNRIVRFFIRRLNFMNRTDLSLPEIRRMTESAARLLRAPRGVAVQPAALGTVPGEWIVPRGAPADRALLYIHGGGFIFCSLATHRALVARLALAAGTRAFSVDYRPAPEHPFPAAPDDCREAYRGLLRAGIEPRRIVVAGDSAGGNLALALMLALREAGEELPAAAVCLSPVTDLTFSGESYRAKAGVDPVFPGGNSRSLAEGIRTGYVASEDPRNPLISPLFADWSGMPPVLLQVGEDEILFDDSVRPAERVRAAGGRAECAVWDGMWRVFQAFAPFVPEADRSIAQIGEFIRGMQRG